MVKLLVSSLMVLFIVVVGGCDCPCNKIPTTCQILYSKGSKNLDYEEKVWFHKHNCMTKLKRHPELP